jgi:transcriptional regulator with XRE-family HTH domain
MEVGVRGTGTLRQRRLGRELRRLREEAGLTLEEAAPRLDWSTSKLSRIETGQQSVDVHGVRSILFARRCCPSVCFQVLPVSLGVHEGMAGSFAVLGFAESGEPAIAYLGTAVNAAHVHKETEVREYRLAFDRLRSVALSPRDSVALVERLVDDL